MQQSKLNSLKQGDIISLKRGYVNAGFEARFVEFVDGGKIKAILCGLEKVLPAKAFVFVRRGNADLSENTMEE